MTFVAQGIVPIVEGPGDKAAAPILVRRVLQERLGRYEFEVMQPKQARDKGNLIKRLENFIAYASKTQGCTAILILLDADRDCPMELGAQLAGRALATVVGMPIAVVCAKRKYENWFLASDEDYTGDAEEFGGAKDWLSDNMPPGIIYRETKHQPSFSATMDIEAAYHASRSFRRLCKAVEELVDAVDNHKTVVTPMG